MYKISGLLSLFITFGLGAVLFWTSQSVQDAQRTLALQKQSVLLEKETIRVLSTEWDYLNRPQRLERLATEGVGMDSSQTDIGIVSDISLIPEPVMPVMPAIKPASLTQISPASGQSAEDGLTENDVHVRYDQGNFDALLEQVEGDQQ